MIDSTFHFPSSSIFPANAFLFLSKIRHPLLHITFILFPWILMKLWTKYHWVSDSHMKNVWLIHKNFFLLSEQSFDEKIQSNMEYSHFLSENTITMFKQSHIIAELFVWSHVAVWVVRPHPHPHIFYTYQSSFIFLYGITQLIITVSQISGWNECAWDFFHFNQNCIERK